jgi:protein arginine N-methyltransferase 1
VYTPAEYGAMLADEVRVRAYLSAIAAAVRPGDVVLELGTGAGYFAVAACRAGAAHVYAVEPNDIIALGPAVAEANGCADRITFIRKRGDQVTLPRRADVLIEDMRGVLSINGTRFSALVDADARLLVPGARRIPRADTMWVAPCRARESLYAVPFANRDGLDGISMAPLRNLARNSWTKVRAAASDLLAEPRQWARLDYTHPGALAVDGVATWTLEESSAVDGWCVWFDAELADGIGMSNAPSAPRAIYGQAFFPLAEPIVVAPGEQLSVRLRSTHAGDDDIWAWDTTHVATDGCSTMIRQSSLAGVLLDTDVLRESAPDAVPAATPVNDVYRSLLELTDGVRSNAEIARELRTRYAGRFAANADALRFVTLTLAAIRADR